VIKSVTRLTEKPKDNARDPVACGRHHMCALSPPQCFAALATTSMSTSTVPTFKNRNAQWAHLGSTE
jgi:hypothetical protein